MEELRTERQDRQSRLSRMLSQDPLMTDSDLARALGVSVATIRLDRGMMGVPELRARARQMAESASARLTSITRDEMFGEVVELEPDRTAVSVLQTGREHAFRHTDIIADHFIYMQAATLAIAVIKEDLVIVRSARADFRQEAAVGTRLIACAKVGTHKDDRYIVSVHTRAAGQELFVARFIVAAVKDETRRVGAESRTAYTGEHPQGVGEAALHAPRADMMIFGAEPRTDR